MKVKELIASLRQFDPELDVAILDLRKQEESATEEGSAEGIYVDMEVSGEQWDLADGRTEDFVSLSFVAYQKCRVCGCTDDDCSQCIEKTGMPCEWVETDLCSACVK